MAMEIAGSSASLKAIGQIIRRAMALASALLGHAYHSAEQLMQGIRGGVGKFALPSRRLDRSFRAFQLSAC
jgi:hypothetical protein